MYDRLCKSKLRLPFSIFAIKVQISRYQFEVSSTQTEDTVDAFTAAVAAAAAAVAITTFN